MNDSGNILDEPAPCSDTDEQTVARIAELSPLEYDQQREAAARQLNIRVKTLDAEVAKLRSTDTEEQAEQVVEEISPWPEQIDGTELLSSIQALYRKHCILHQDDHIVMPMMALATYAFDAFPVFPKVLIRSPEKRCGKTVLLEVSEAIVYRGLMSSSITASSIFRTIDAHHPTLIIDEADTFMAGDDAIRGVINSSHRRRNAFVIRTEKVGDCFVPRRFTTWSPMFIAGIGSQADTIEDRSIIVDLRRKLAGERVAKCPVDLFERSRSLRQKCLRWAEDHFNHLKLADFDMPDCSNDRAADNWLPLFAIARLIGDPWQSQIERAYIAKNAVAEDEAIGVMLLSDIRDIFLENNWLKMHSEDLVERLVELEDRPWPEWKHGKSMTKNSLAKLLKPYKIKSKQVWIPTQQKPNRYGYERSQFEDAWRRYVNDDATRHKITTLNENARSLEPASDGRLPHFVNASGVPALADLKSLNAKHGGASSVLVFSQGEDAAARPTLNERTA